MLAECVKFGVGLVQLCGTLLCTKPWQLMSLCHSRHRDIVDLQVQHHAAGCSCYAILPGPSTPATHGLPRQDLLAASNAAKLAMIPASKLLLAQSMMLLETAVFWNDRQPSHVSTLGMLLIPTAIVHREHLMHCEHALY